MAQFDYNLRDFYGTNNDPQTQRYVDSGGRPARKRRVDTLQPPSLQEYTPSTTLSDLPVLGSNPAPIPRRDDAGESKGQALATGIASLLALLGGGNVAQSAVAGFSGMKAGQDRLYANRLKSYDDEEKRIKAKFDADSKSFANRLALAKMEQSGVNSRNQNELALANLKTRQAGMADNADRADMRLDLDYQKMAQSQRGKLGDDPKTKALLTERQYVLGQLKDTAFLKSTTPKQIKALEVRLGEINKYLGISGSVAGRERLGLSDQEMATQQRSERSYQVQLESLGLRGATLELARRRLQMAEDAAPVIDATRRARLDRIRNADKLGTGQVMKIEEMYGDADKVMGEGRKYFMLAETGKMPDGSDISEEMRGLYRNMAKDLFIRAGRMTESADKLLSIGTKSPGVQRAVSGPRTPLGIPKPVPISVPGVGKVKITEQSGKKAPKKNVAPPPVGSGPWSNFKALFGLK